MSSSFLFLKRAIQYNLFAIALALSSIGRVLAADGTWIDSDGDGLWSDTANWSGGTIADGSGSTANFNTLDANPATVNTNFPGFYRNAIGLDTSRTIGNLIFGDSDTSTPGGWEVYVPSGTPVLTLAGTTPTITVNPLGPIDTGTLGDATPEFIDDAIIRMSIAGTQGLTKAGTGILTLTGPTNTITGGINITAGTLRQRSVINGQVITIGNGAMLDTNQSLRNVAVPTGGAVHSIVVASGNTATIRTNNSLGNISASGATLNIQIPGNSTLSADDNWAVNGSPAAVNFTGLGAGSSMRLRSNGGAFNAGASFQNSAVTLDNLMVFERTGTGGNTVNIGSLAGTSTAILSGGGQGGGQQATYFVGSLNTNTEYAGQIDITSAPVSGTNNGGLNLIKVGSGTLTLSGNLTYQPTLNGTLNRRGGVTSVSAGTLAMKNNAQVPGGVVGQNSVLSIKSGATLDVSLSTLPGGYNSAPLQTIVGVGSVSGNFVHDDGILAAGDTIPGDTGTNPTPVPVSVAGTLTFNSLSFNQAATSGAGGNIKFDISPSTSSGNDLIQVNGVTTLTGNPTLSPSFLGGFTTGTYTIINSTGGFTGNASGWTVAWPGRGTAPSLAINGNQLQMTVGAGSTGNVNWTGAADGNWVPGASGPINWWNNLTNVADRMFDLDSVTFADTYGPSNTAVTNSTISLNATATPLAVIVNNSAVNYSITTANASKITGSATFTKQGSGSLILQTPNDFTGAAAIQGGTVDIGSQNGALGTGALTMSGGGKLIVATDTSVAITNNGINIPTGQSATIVSNGSTANPANNPLTLATGTGLSGGGNLLVTTQVSGRRIDLASGNASFTGTLTLAPDTTAGATSLQVRFNGNGSSLNNGSMVLNSATLQDRATSVQTIAIGSLSGDSTSTIAGFSGGSTATAKTWQIGSLNASTTFAGSITNGSGSNSTTAVSHLTKVGTGTLILSGNTDYSGTTTINGGTLLVNGTHLPNASVTGANPNYVVNSGATLGGTGTIGNGTPVVPITVNVGGTLSPGASIGTLTTFGNVSFADATSIFKVEADGTSSTSDLLAVTGDLTLNGASLMASLLSGTTPSGPYTVATYTGILSGTFTAPAGISVDYSTLGQITMTINSLGTPGDYNGDTKINVADYVTWRKNPGGNGNDPGYVTWRENFNPAQGSASSLANAAVPEPATSILALFVAALAFKRTNRK